MPSLEIHEPPAETREIFANNEPSHPVVATLRLERQALNLLTALASYDGTSPAEQIRTATTLYLRQRLGNQAVQDFMTEREKQLQQIDEAIFIAKNGPE